MISPCQSSSCLSPQKLPRGTNTTAGSAHFVMVQMWHFPGLGGGGCRPENRNTWGIITYQQSRKITETYGNNMKRLSDLGDWKWMKMGYEITMLFTISGKIKQYDRRFIFASTKCVSVNFLQFVSEKEYGWVIYHPTRIQYTCVI